jgi:hypothetical protein
MTKRSLVLTVGLLAAALISAGSVSSYQRELELQKAERLNEVSYKQILDGAAAKPSKLSVNYDNAITTSSPLIFGGAHTPLEDHQDAWDKMQEAGVTMIRRDFFIEQVLPSNITIDDYRSNKNNIQDPKNWNQDTIKSTQYRYQEAHKRGMKTMGIVDYEPAWLSASHTSYGMPTDWTVYEDLVKKMYSLYRNDLDYLEIWNEPTYDRFMDVTNSNLTMEEIYIEISKHTIKAIREVDKEKNDGKIIPIGGLVADNPVYTGKTLEAMLKVPELKNGLSFISYHNYGHPEPSSELFRNILKANDLPNMPLFLTEWNSTSDEHEQLPEKIGDKAITYTAKQFLTYIDQNLAGANYYMMEPVDFDIPGIGKKYMGFYRWEGDKAVLLPQAKTWRLFSAKMGMGAGESKIYPVRSDNSLFSTLGFTNSKGQHGFIIVNDSPTAQMANVTAGTLGLKRFARIQMYNASPSNDASKPVYDGRMKVDNNSLRLNVYVPAQGITGVVITKEKEWYDFFNVLN